MTVAGLSTVAAHRPINAKGPAPGVGEQGLGVSRLQRRGKPLSKPYMAAACRVNLSVKGKIVAKCRGCRKAERLGGPMVSRAVWVEPVSHDDSLLIREISPSMPRLSA